MGADVSEDGVYRYSLSRRLSVFERALCVVGYNPSTAAATKDDATIRTVVGFARQWGFDWLFMANLHAYRSTDPKRIATLDDLEAVGPRNKEALYWMTQRAEIVVAAWGHNRLNPYAAELAQMVLRLERTKCLGKNKDGSPKHPLYLPHTTALVAV